MSAGIEIKGRAGRRISVQEARQIALQTLSEVERKRKEEYAREARERGDDSARKEAGQWQPIETAPKDGSPVLAWRKGWEYPSFVRWILNRRTETTFWNDRDEWDAYENENESPTHWFYIPDPPEGRGY